MSDHTVGTRGSMRFGAFVATFLGAWLALDRLAAAPPVPASALMAIACAATVLIAGEIAFDDAAVPDLPARLGLVRPAPRALVAAVIVGLAAVATSWSGAALMGVHLELRSNWPAVVVGSLLFHGVAEELVWRGFAFGHVRRRAGFWPAIARTVPLIALTHVPIIVDNGVVLGTLAVVSAAVTCLPFSYLWERGGHAIWAPAILHGLVGMWQVVERPFPDEFSVVILTASILVPLGVFAFGDRFFGAPSASAPRAGVALEVR